MLTRYFKRPTTQATSYGGPAGPSLDAFTQWLAQRGYLHESIRRRLQGAAQFVTWAQTPGGHLQSLSPDALEHFRQHLCQQGQLCRAHGQHSVRWLGAQLVFEFLQAQQPVASATRAPAPEPPALLTAFAQWMHRHRGVMYATVLIYRPHVILLLTELAPCLERLEAGPLRAAILAYAQHRSAPLVKKRVTVARRLLRFLIATGRGEPGLEAAIPALAQWRLATWPRYLLPEDVERVIAACESSTSRDSRNKAILLLLARLGLRASDVARLQLAHIDWTQGPCRVMGKSRRAAKLPLPQDVGDAILPYLHTARPSSNCDFVFLTAIASWTPITSPVVTTVAAQAIPRAGVQAPSDGAHVLRHSAATGLLRQGASLQVIGEVLRHRSVETPAHYAKVDVAVLQHVVMPWPGAPSC